MIYDGDMIGQACVCHLPTMIMMNMRLRHHFYHYLHNRWWNRMILIADTDIYPELIATQVWSGKICDTLGEWFLNPSVRSDMILQWDKFIKKAMCYKPVNHKVVPERDIQIAGETVDEFLDPMTVIAKHALETARAYTENVESKSYLKIPAAAATI